MNPLPQNTRHRDRVRQMLQVTWFRIFVNAAGAALIWGSWAAFVHRNFELHILLKAAFTQAFLSAFFTLMGVTLLEAIFARAPEPVRVPFSALSTFAFVLVSVLVIHTVSGTPNVLFTVAPTMILSLFYCFGYAVSLKKIRMAAS